MLSQISGGFDAAFSLGGLLAAVLGALLGTAVGVIPGMAPTAVLGLFLPTVAVLRPEVGLIFLGSIYFGTQYGDSMSAILMNVPSEAPAVVMARDGYKMTLKGRAGAALTVAATGSFVGGLIGVIGLAFFAPLISSVALSFGPASFFLIALLGMVLLSIVSGGSIVRNGLALALGMCLTTIGQDAITGQSRLTFGSQTLLQGFDVVPIAIGMFGMSTILQMMYEGKRATTVPRIRLREMPPTRDEWRQASPGIARGAGTGLILGMLPGPALVLTTFVSYWFESLTRRGPVRAGEGAPNAVAGPKAADDAAVGATLAPVVALGLPFTPITAVLYAGLLLTGLTPGPEFIKNNPTVFWGLVAGLLVANIVLLLLNLPLASIWVALLRIPRPVLNAIMLVLMMIGTFSLRNSQFDVVVMLLAGVLGLVLRAAGIERSLVVLGLILGPIFESSLRQSLILSQGTAGVFFNSGLNIGIIVVLALVVVARLTVKPIASYLARRRGDDAASHGSESAKEVAQ